MDGLSWPVKYLFAQCGDLLWLLRLVAVYLGNHSRITHAEGRRRKKRLTLLNLSLMLNVNVKLILLCRLFYVVSYK